MADMNYQTMVSARDVSDSIKNWLNSSSAPSEAILRDAELWLYRRLRVREMLTRNEAVTLAKDADTIVLSTLTPTYRAPFHLMMTGIEKRVPSRRLLDFVLSQRSWDADGNRVPGKPSFWATDAENIIFESTADKAYTISFTYYGDGPILAPTQQTNFLTTKYPFMLRHAIMMYGNEWKEDERRKLYYRKAADDDITDCNADSDLELEGVEMEVMLEGGSPGLHGFGNL